MQHCRLISLIFSLTISCLSFAETQPDSDLSQEQFFHSIEQLCGQAFAGKVVVDNVADSSFADKSLIIHLRKCSENEIQMPFHVGDDSSRTFILKKTATGLSLHHDHRHKDGSPDELTLYGGHTLDSGWPQVQSFPADHYTKELFIKNAIPQSIGNTWQIYVYPTKISYRMVREAREFRVDFDLTKAIDPPAAPWGYKDD